MKTFDYHCQGFCVPIFDSFDYPENTHTQHHLVVSPVSSVAYCELDGRVPGCPWSIARRKQLNPFQQLLIVCSFSQPLIWNAAYGSIPQIGCAANKSGLHSPFQPHLLSLENIIEKANLPCTKASHFNSQVATKRRTTTITVVEDVIRLHSNQGCDRESDSTLGNQDMRDCIMIGLNKRSIDAVVQSQHTIHTMVVTI